MRLTYRLLKNVSKTNLIKTIRTQGVAFGFGNESQKTTNSSKTVVVEYSSPNIAKPFHIGHLRSTILGNYIANLYERLGWKVVRLNYLGDWGTQFGLLAVGFQRYGNEEELQANPLHHLFEIYVKINADVAVEKEEGKTLTHQEGMGAFRKMEQGDAEMLNIWKRFKDISIDEYCKLYKRLGVTFTDFHSESMYDKEAISLVERLKQTGVLQTDSKGRGYIQIGTGKGIPENVRILKSDGTTLYITRDIAAIIDRLEKYKFDKIHYIVENGQYLHFNNLCGVMNSFPDWKDRLNEDIHVKFGRIEGISSRNGNVVFLNDVLDEAAGRFKSSMMGKKTSKIDEKDIDAVAEELGKSSIIVQDLGQRRIKNYEFNWERIMYSAKIQYCHARLCGIERSSGITLDEDFTEQPLTTNKQAEDLLSHLDKFGDVIEESFSTLEPYLVVRYLDQLCDYVNAAYKTCNVKYTDPVVGQAYLHMFSGSKIVLANGMTLLGLCPQERM